MYFFSHASKIFLSLDHLKSQIYVDHFFKYGNDLRSKNEGKEPCQTPLLGMNQSTDFEGVKGYK